MTQDEPDQRPPDLLPGDTSVRLQSHNVHPEQDQKSRATPDVSGSGPTGAGLAWPTPRDETNAPQLALRNPPRSADRLGTWLWMLLCLMLACPALLIGLYTAHVTDQDEARTTATSIQTWRHYGELTKANRFSLARYEPYLNRRSQWRHPPGISWLHMAFFANTAHENSSVDQLVMRARLVSVGAALMMIACVFWAGHSIGGLTTASLAALACAANPMFLYFARLATSTAAGAAAGYMSIAAALWAIRPLRRAPSVERQFIGWLICGIAMGAAIAIRGLWALPELTIVIVLLLILCPNRISHLLGLVAALLIAVLIVAPWALYAHEHDVGAWRQWLATAAPAENWFHAQTIWQQGSLRTVLLLAALLPWTLWVLAAAIQPFSTSSVGSRTPLFLGLVWFASLVVLLMVRRGADQRSDVLGLLPASAVVVGQLFNQYSMLTDEGRSPRFWRLLRWPHLLLFAAASIAIPLFPYVLSNLVERGLPEKFTVAPPSWPFAVGLAIALLAVVMLSARWALKDQPRLSHAAWSIWTLVLVSVLTIPAAERSLKHGSFVQKLRQTDTSKEMFWLYSDRGNATEEPDLLPLVLLYTQRDEIRVISRADVADLAQKAAPFYVVGRDAQSPGEFMTLVHRAPRHGLSLWRHESAQHQQ